MAYVNQAYETHARKLNSRGIIVECELIYIVSDVLAEQDALTAVYAVAPKSQSNVAELQSVEIAERLTDTDYKVKVAYSANAYNYSGDVARDSDDNRPTREPSTMSFDCGGGTMHVTHAINQVWLDGSVPAGLAIGWNGKYGNETEVTGIDIPTAQLRETYTRSFRKTSITTTYKRRVALLVGKVNSGNFKGWQRGEVRFLGCSYSTPTDNSKYVTITFNFEISPSETVDMYGHKISKEGWQYVWAMSKTEVSRGGVPQINVKGVYKAQVCHYGDFSDLGL